MSLHMTRNPTISVIFGRSFLFHEVQPVVPTLYHNSQDVQLILEISEHVLCQASTSWILA